MKSYTDLEQSKKLAEILPLESADMCFNISQRTNMPPLMTPYGKFKEFFNMEETPEIIVIVPAYFNSEQCTSWDIDIWAGDNYEHPFEDYPTYEEAFEAALKYALENLI